MIFQNTACEMLAAAVLELFPTTQLIGAEVSNIGFHYDFLFQKAICKVFGPRELLQVEDQMRLIASQKRPIEQIEMMRENAMTFFEHQGQWERVHELGECDEILVALFKMGAFHDLCCLPFAKNSEQCGQFKLLECQTLPSGVVRIFGTSFETKDDLKTFLKKSKEYKEYDPAVWGEKMGFFVTSAEKKIYLPAGEELLHSLVEKWREMHSELGFALVSGLGEWEMSAIAQMLFDKKEFKVAQIDVRGSDFVSIFCDRENLTEEVISSLLFLEQTIKIFGFERRIYLLSSKRGNHSLDRVKEALDKSGFSYEEEPSFDKRAARIEWRLVDKLGRLWPASYVEVSDKEYGRKRLIVRSLFGSSIEKWMMLLIELNRSKKS